MDCDVIDLICLGLARNGLFLFQFLVQMLHLAVYRVQIKGCTGKTDRFICNLLAEHRVVYHAFHQFCQSLDVSRLKQ